MNNTDLRALGAFLAEKGLLSHSLNMPQADTIALCGCDCDSRMVDANHLFICKGAAFRPAYLTSALEAGAVAYLCDEEHVTELAGIAPGVPALVVSDLRSAMALASAEAWGHPDRRIPVVGITGTKGKTTVAYFVRAILDGKAPLSRAASLGTLETYDGVERMVSRNTTPEAPDLWRHLAHAADHDLTMVMEVSSQGLKYQRVEGLSFDVAAFLNIGVDHVSPIEHPTFEDYLASKLKIFEMASSAIVNAHLDPAHASRIIEAARTCQNLSSFSLDGTGPSGLSPQVWASDITPLSDGISFLAHTPAWTSQVTIHLSGLFNVENALAALAIALSLGCSQEQILSGLSACRVPGRMDLVKDPNHALTVLVDYAHNGMAVEKVLSSIRESYPTHYVVAVFGATGGKGAERRFEMPKAAAPFANHLVFTEDDPGPEPVERICAQMMEATPQGTSAEVILDREEAIRHALDLARSKDSPAIVCILGKGHEARQLRKDGPHLILADGELVRQLLGLSS